MLTREEIRKLMTVENVIISLPHISKDGSISSHMSLPLSQNYFIGQKLLDSLPLWPRVIIRVFDGTPFNSGIWESVVKTNEVSTYDEALDFIVTAKIAFSQGE